MTWLNGAELEPPPPETSKWERDRYSNLRAEDELDDDELCDWIGRAADLPGDETF